MSPIESRIIKTLESGPRSVQEIYEAACCSESSVHKWIKKMIRSDVARIQGFRRSPDYGHGIPVPLYGLK
jgi:hypothetical protein